MACIWRLRYWLPSTLCCWRSLHCKMSTIIWSSFFWLVYYCKCPFLLSISESSVIVLYFFCFIVMISSTIFFSRLAYVLTKSRRRVLCSDRADLILLKSSMKPSKIWVMLSLLVILCRKLSWSSLLEFLSSYCTFSENYYTLSNACSNSYLYSAGQSTFPINDLTNS